MKKFLITALLGLFMFIVASINAETIQRDVGDVGFTEGIELNSECYLANQGSAVLPVNFCQRTEVLPFCEATPLIRSSVFTEFLWPMERNIYFTLKPFNSYNYIPIRAGNFSSFNSPYFI